MMGTVAVTVPGGYATETRWRRDLWLRPLCGSDEVYLAEGFSAAFPAERTTALLSRCLFVAADSEPATPAFCRSLSVGDREALLLQLRGITYGSTLDCVLECPDCEEKMDLELQVRDLLLAAYGIEGQRHSATVEDGGETYQIEFRLPNGEDQEQAAKMVGADLEAAIRLVLRRCISSIQATGGNQVDEIVPAVRERLPTVLAELDPQAEILLNAACPGCGAAVTIPFDAAHYLDREIKQKADYLYGEVHLLAMHYHWSESEILAMTPSQRRRYLQLLGYTTGERCVS